MNRPIIIGRRHSGQQVLDVSHCGQRRRRLERRAPARSGTAAARLRIVAGFRTSSSVSPEVRGPLDKKIVRRTARRHVNEARYCYEQGLARARDLEGRFVVVRFTIERHDVTRYTR